MNIVTIMNYSDTSEYNKMCCVFVDQLFKHNTNFKLFVIHKNTLPEQVQRKLSEYHEIKTLKLGADTNCWYPHHNVNYKLYNLCKIDEQFIFLDADIFCLGDLKSLWNLRNDKPYIGINHQNIPGHTDANFKFLNSGVQIIGDPEWYKYENFKNAFVKSNRMLLCKGFDQAHIFTYCKQIDYDYTHSLAGYQWNSCAKYGVFDDTLSCKYVAPVDDVEPDGYDVMLNHYWWDFKPWKLNCPIYNRYGIN